MRPTTSASNLFRRKLCPGSARMEDGMPEEDSPESREGQLLHDFDSNPNLDQAFLKPGQRDLLALNQSLVGQIVKRVFEKKAPVMVPMTSMLKNKYISGTPDLLFATSPPARQLLINDAKFGYKLVERAELNLQLRTYAVLVWDCIGQAEIGIHVSITQPRLKYEERISLALYTPNDIAAANAEITWIVQASEKRGAKLIAGESQCRYCKAKIKCPAFRKQFGDLKLIRYGSGDLSVTLRESKLEEKLKSLTNDQLEKVLTAIRFAGIAEKPALAEARRRMKGETPLTNYQLGKDYEVREIADTPKAISLLSLARIRTRDEALALATISLSKIEEAYRTASGCTKEAATNKINEVLSTVIQKTMRAGKLTKK